MRQAPTNQNNPTYDVAIIGAGVVGCAMARRFTLEGARVVVLEKAPDILDGASKANSAILHTGFDAPAGSLELACVQNGHQEYLEIREAFGFVHEKSGALVVAWTQKELDGLEGLRAKAHANGVADVEIITAKALAAREPALSQRASGAIIVPGEGIIDPWSSPYAYLRQALENGAALQTSCAVTRGTFDGDIWQLETSTGPVSTRHVINCAGLYGDHVDEALLGATRFKITPRKGQFVVFDKAACGLVNSIILPVPSARTKGIVVFRTVFGNLAVGPTAEDQQSRSDTATDETTLQALIADGIAKIPALEGMPITATYAGLRPASEEKDYRIYATPGKNWITVGGIRSTGLSAALGIALHVFGLYRKMGASPAALANPSIPAAKILAESGQRDWQQANHGEVICHCELVTKREIEAALKGPLAAGSLAGLKRQTRVTMGRCQGFYCSAKLAKLTDGHFNLPISEEIAK